MGRINVTSRIFEEGSVLQPNNAHQRHRNSALVPKVAVQTAKRRTVSNLTNAVVGARSRPKHLLARFTLC
jgi:hypothetical protein